MEGRKWREEGGEEEVEGGRGGKERGMERMENGGRGGGEGERDGEDGEWREGMRMRRNIKRRKKREREKGGEGWKLINRVKHCELSSMYTPLTLLTQYTACLSLCCLSISGTSHWRPRWPQRKC